MAGIRLRTVYAITCENCEETEYYDETEADAYDCAVCDGWENRNGYNICSRCIDNTEEEE